MYKTLSVLSGSVILGNRPLKFTIPIVWDLKATELQNLLWEYTWKAVRNYLEVIEDIIKALYKNKISQNRQMSHFFTPRVHPMPNAIKIGLCDLFPVLLEWITFYLRVEFSGTYATQQEFSLSFHTNINLWSFGCVLLQWSLSDNCFVSVSRNNILRV